MFEGIGRKIEVIMQNRRKFFGNLGIIIAAATAPTIFIPKNSIKWGTPLLYVPKTYKLKTKWSKELEQDLKAYHGINTKYEIEQAYERMVDEEIKTTFPNQEIICTERFFCHDPINFNPYVLSMVVVNERVA